MAGQNQNVGGLIMNAMLKLCWTLGATIGAIAFFIGQPTIAQSSHFRAAEGFTEPYKTVIVASPESGVLQTLSVREGDRINKGDIISQLDSHVLIASLNSARERLKALGKINGAKSNVSSKAHHLNQIQSLYRREHASNKEVRQAQLEYDLAFANLETAKDEMRALAMNMKQIEAQLERRIVRAPISGTILELPRQVGEAITASESQVATIVALDKLRIRYFLSTAKAVKIQRGQRVEISIPDMNQHAVAAVDFVSPVTDSKSRTVRVELIIDNKEQRYRSGLRCILGTIHTAANNFTSTK